MKELLSLLSSRFEAFTHPVTVTAPGVPGPPPLPDLEMLYGLQGSQMSLMLFTEGPLHRLAPFQPPSPESQEFHEQRLPRRYKVPEQHRAEGHKPTRPKEALQCRDRLFFVLLPGHSLQTNTIPEGVDCVRMVRCSWRSSL